MPGKSTEMGINIYNYRLVHFDELKPKLDVSWGINHHITLEDDT